MNPENQNGYTLQPKSSLLQSISILFIFLLNVPWSWRKKRCELPGILDVMHKCAKKRCMYFCVNLMNTNNTKFNNKKTFRKHCYNIKISIHIMNIYFCTDVCAKWSSKRTQCPVSKTQGGGGVASVGRDAPKRPLFHLPFSVPGGDSKSFRRS